MSNSKDRLPLFPSRANLSYTKSKIGYTKRGHKLLKDKKETLSFRQRVIIMELIQRKRDLAPLMTNAIYSFNRAKFLAADINSIGLYASPESDIHILISYNNIAGVLIPAFEIEINQQSSNNAYALAGLGKGGQQLLDIRKKFQEVIIDLVKIATKMFANKALNVAIKQTSIRVNALENILLPRLLNTQGYILEELNEYEREEFFRMKKSKLIKTKNNLYAENLKADQDLEIAKILYKSMQPEEFINLRKSLSQSGIAILKNISNKNSAFENSTAL